MENNDVVISTRVSLFRNAKGYPFSIKLNDKRALTITSAVYDAVNSKGNYKLYNFSEISEYKTQRFLEKNFVSTRCARSTNGSLVLRDDESVAVQLFGSEHIKIQAMVDGFDIKTAIDKANETDDAISAKVKYAYSDKLGYLTSSLALVGTGMRINVKLFLPGLYLTDAIQSVTNALSRINVSLTPVSKTDNSNGYVYNLSSVHTLGVSEAEIEEKVKTAVENVLSYEERAREKILKENEISLKDKIMRSYGIATNCYKMSESEMYSLLSLIKLGAYYKILPITAVNVIDKLISTLTSATIIEGRKEGFKSSVDRDIYRATKVKETLKTL